MTNEQRMIVSALRAQGMGYGAIARKVGISENTVKSFCRRNAQKEDKPVTGADEHQCLCCGTPVAQNAGRKEKKFCSDKCRNKWWNAHLVGPQRFTLKATRRKGGFFYECGIFGKRVSSKLSNGPPL